jgi:succinylarginine dihydrolase
MAAPSATRRPATTPSIRLGNGSEEAIARNHLDRPDHAQHPRIDAGVFHNDVIAVGHDAALAMSRVGRSGRRAARRCRDRSWVRAIVVRASRRVVDAVRPTSSTASC